MKPLISKPTEEFLKSLESRVEEDVVNYFSGKDELDRLIVREDLRIRNIFLDRPIDLMIVVLNNKKIIKRKISEFNGLEKATDGQLTNFINDGTGIHWPELDYDLSLKGFLEYELTHVDNPFT